MVVSKVLRSFFTTLNWPIFKLDLNQFVGVVETWDIWVDVLRVYKGEATEDILLDRLYMVKDSTPPKFTFTITPEPTLRQWLNSQGLVTEKVKVQE